MKLWFIIGPNKKPVVSCERAYAASTRMGCIELWCCGRISGMEQAPSSWAEWKRIGYRCERREVGK